MIQFFFDLFVLAAVGVVAFLAWIKISDRAEARRAERQAGEIAVLRRKLGYDR